MLSLFNPCDLFVTLSEHYISENDLRLYVDVYLQKGMGASMFYHQSSVVAVLQFPHKWTYPQYQPA